MTKTRKSKPAPKARKPRVIAYRHVTMYGAEWLIHGNGRKLTGRECRDAAAALNVYFDGVSAGKGR